MKCAGRLGAAAAGVVGVALALGLAACGSAPDDELQQWMNEQRASANPRIKPIAPPKPFKAEDYAPVSPLDPFDKGKLNAALQRERAQNSASEALIAPERQRRKDPLEDFPLDGMTLVGTLVRGGQTVALVKAGNLLHRVAVGAHLGQNFGRVLRITETELSLRELVQDPAGDWVERPASLQLQQRTK